ncbi:MAG: pyrroline-5-carboxylate reductase [Ruminococcaceae bacterium]|nr:pyrroline-5-carboxylate reductase [Oscillospiraceae bacterium]
MSNILFIGAGNMASAIANGIIKANVVNAYNIYLFDKNTDQYCKFDPSCNRAESLSEAFKAVDYVFLSVKPQNIKDVLASLKDLDYTNKTFISICAGITINSIEKALPNAKIIRTMPNTPLMIGQGVTAICKNDNVGDGEFEFVKSIFSSSGYVTEIAENDINSLTAITSSSPAYIFLFAKSMLEGANKLGFEYQDTLKMICNTLIGSANLILSSDKSLDELIAMVKSPNGTTEKALNVFEEKNFLDIVSQAMLACTKRAEELSKLN